MDSGHRLISQPPNISENLLYGLGSSYPSFGFGPHPQRADRYEEDWHAFR